MSDNLWNTDVFPLFLPYAATVVIKMLVMSAVISSTRVFKKVFENPEDSISTGGDSHTYVRKDALIERLRRCHQNDLENITPFLITGLLYAFTGPSVFAATWHFRVFVISRFLHTFAYLMAIRQPTRFIFMYIGWGSTFSMALHCLGAGHF